MLPNCLAVFKKCIVNILYIVSYVETVKMVLKRMNMFLTIMNGFSLFESNAIEEKTESPLPKIARKIKAP